MTGAPRSAYADADFIIIRGEAVRILGDYTTAGVFQRIAWRCERTGAWRVSMEELAAEVWLTPKQVRRALDILREKGWLTSVQEKALDKTLTYRIHFDDSVSAGQARTPSRAFDAPSGALPSALQGTSSLKTDSSPMSPNADDLAEPRDIPPNPPQAGGACVKHPNGDGINCRGCGTTNRARERSQSAEALALRRAQDAEELRKARESKPAPEVAVRGAAMARELLNAKRHAG